MRIVIDMQGAQTSFSRKRGVGRYTIDLIKAIALNSTEHEIILALNGAFPDIIDPIRVEFEGILPRKNIRVWQQLFDTAAINPKNIWRRKAGEILREEFLNSLKASIIFSTNLQEGLFDPACTSVKTLPTDSIIVSTLHDVIPLIYPKQYLSDPINRTWYEEKINAAKASDIIITVSHSSKAEISKLLGVPDEKIYVIENAVNHNKFKPFYIETNDKEELLTKLKISNHFVMYAGGSDRHKNLDLLYSAFSKLPKIILDEYILVMVGDGTKYEEALHRSKLKKLGINDNVIFTGQLTDEDLIMLYNLCDLFVFPSINEGFGLPPLEAMACGAAVLASDASSLPEVVGLRVDALFDPYDDVSLAKKIEHTLTNSEFKALLKEQGIRQAKKFSWDYSARALLCLFEDIIKNSSLKSSSPNQDPIKNIIYNVASLDSNLSFDTEDLKALSSSIADTFCSRDIHENKLFLDVSSVITLDHLSGIQRVVLAICNELIKNQQITDVELIYTTTDDHEFYRATALIDKILGRPTKIANQEWIEFCQGDILLFLDLHPGVAITHQEKTQMLRNKGVSVYHIVYDLLPALNPEFFWQDLCVEFNEWLSAISRSDGAICISRSVADELKGWLITNPPNRICPYKIGWFHLGADVENAVPTRGLPNDMPQVLAQLKARPSFLMVGTVEPRKGHAQTIAAFERLWADGLDVNLVIIGRQGWMVEMLLETLRHHPEHGKRLFWLEGISDEYLEKIYSASTCLIVSSEGEGFCLPLIEASKHKLPIIARDIPVLHEVAGDYAFYFMGKEPIELAIAIKDWFSLYKSGKHPKSDSMPWLTWKQSAQQLIDIIVQEKWQYTLEYRSSSL